MICNPLENGWELIYQQAHALLAAKLVTYWQHPERPARWSETLIAIAEHDNGWQEWESGSRLNAVGAPRHFMDTPPEDIVVQGERVVARGWHKSLWVGLLVSSHISSLHEPKRGMLPELDALLDEQLRKRDQWRDVLGVTEADVEEAYALLRWADNFSLMLCMRQIPFDQRRVEIGPGPDGTLYFVRQRAEGTLEVEPWPYTEDEFPVSVDGYRLEQLAFQHDQELVDRLHAASVTPLEWRLRRWAM